MSSTTNVTQGTWSQLPSTARAVVPLARSMASMAYDFADHYVLLFGGNSGLPRWNGFLNDTWAFQNGTWTNLTAGLTTAPCPRGDAPMTYDARDGVILLVGGYDGGNVPGCPIYSLNDTWEFSHGRWIHLPARLPAGGSYDGLLSYDAEDGYPLYFGGNASNQTYKFVGGAWVLLHPVASPPGVQWMTRSATMTYDSADRQVVLFGGPLGSGLNETWAFTGGNWSVVSSSPSPPGSPAPGTSSLSDFSTRGFELLADSPVASSGNLSGDLQAWEFAANSWVNVSGPVSPPPRVGFSTTFDPVANATILFGGSRSTLSGCCLLNETWVWEALASGPSSGSHPGSSVVPWLVGSLAVTLVLSLATVVFFTRLRKKR